MTTIARMLTLGLVSLAGACLPVPHSHTVRPRFALRVVQPDSTPLVGAQVHVYSGRILSTDVPEVLTQTADSHGGVRFDGHRRLHLIAWLVPDGDPPARTFWCAEALGMASLYGEVVSSSDRAVMVTLSPDTLPSPCPSAPESLEELEAAALRQGPARESLSN